MEDKDELSQGRIWPAIDVKNFISEQRQRKQIERDILLGLFICVAYLLVRTLWN